MTLRASESSWLGRTLAVLFGLAFLGGGLAVGYFLLFPELHARFNARAYVPVQAELVHVELKTNHGSKSTTYETKARYRYTFDGRSYTSTRVTFSNGADKFGSYQNDLYVRLNNAHQRRATVEAWVNPANPTDAVLDRGMRWGLFTVKSIFFLVFTSIGLIVCYLALRPAPAAATPDKPWLANPAWRDGRITSGSRSAVFGAWIMALAFSAVSIPMPLILENEIAKRNWAALLGLLFPLASAWLIYRAIHKTLEWRRFGALVLKMDPFPGAVGGIVAGTIELAERFRPGETFNVTLNCVRQRVTGSGRNRDRSNSVVWQNEMPVQVETSGRGSRVSFRFDVPPGLPPTSAKSNDYHFWFAHLYAELPGIDLDHSFEIPVVTIADGATVPAVSTVPFVPVAPPPIPARILQIRRENGSTVFYYPLLRYPSMGVGMLVFGAIFGGATVFLYSQARGFAGVIPGFMALVFGALSVGLILFGLYSLGNTLRVDISARGLTATRRVFGIPFSTHVPLDEISGIESKITSQIDNDARLNVRYTLYAQRYAGRRVAVGDDIPGQPLANHVMQSLRSACGIRPAGS